MRKHTHPLHLVALIILTLLALITGVVFISTGDIKVGFTSLVCLFLACGTTMEINLCNLRQEIRELKK